MIILQGNTLYTVFTSCKMKVLDQRILNTLASSEILKLTCDVNRWLRLLNFYSCVEYNQVKFCLYTFSPPGMDCYFCNKFKKMGNSWVVLIWNKDCCHWASIWWGRWSPTVLWRQKCLFKSAFRLNDIEYHLSRSWGCFQTHDSEGLFWLDRLFKWWMKHILSPTLLFGIPSAASLFALRIKPKPPNLLQRL